jgi:hypothetical protein
MNLIDYNGEGDWSRSAILERYARYAGEMGVAPRDLSPSKHSEGERRWIYPVMENIIAGIEAGDPACVVIGIEFIEQDASFPFGKILKSNTARALRRASITEAQQHRIRRRVLDMLRRGAVPHEFKEYAKLLKKIGVGADDLGDVEESDEHVARFKHYLSDRSS